MIKIEESQLRFDLEEFDEIEEDASERSISYEEARQISETARQVLNVKFGELPEWWNDYLKLIEQGWPWRVACYIAWAASPKMTRKPATLGELAQMLGLRSPRSIHRWKAKYPTINHVVALMLVAQFWEHRRDVLDALAQMAATADYKTHNDRKLFLEMTGDYVPKSKLELGKAAKGGEQEMSDEELREWLGEEAKNNTKDIKETKENAGEEEEKGSQ
jgi:hypothetical protein